MVFFGFFSSFSAYELPKVELETKKPQIVLFMAENVQVDKKPSYLIKWRTVNATDVMLTFFGRVEISGEVTVTEEEFNRGAITLTATNKDNSAVANKTINNERHKDDPITVFVKPEEEEIDTSFRTMPYTPYRNRPLRRGYY